MAGEKTPVDGYVPVNGLRIHYLDWSNAGAPVMLMLHGLTRFAHALDGVARHFCDRFHVIAYDLRGHGNSDWDPQGRYDMETHLSDLEAFIDQKQACGCCPPLSGAKDIHPFPEKRVQSCRKG